MIIYKITNNVNQKIYIGQTIHSIKTRWSGHCRSKPERSGIMSAAIKKYGKENFKIEEVDSANTLEELNQKEIFWICHYNSLSPNGYNLNPGGNSSPMHPDTKKKLSEINRGKRHSEETKRKISELIKIGKFGGNKGRTWRLSEEVKRKMSERRKQMYENKTEEEKKIISEAAKERYRLKHSESATSPPKSQKTKSDLSRSEIMKLWHASRTPEEKELSRQVLSKARKSRDYSGHGEKMKAWHSKNKISRLINPGGWHHTEESKRKMPKTLKKLYETNPEKKGGRPKKMKGREFIQLSFFN